MTKDIISSRLGDILPGVAPEKRNAQAEAIHQQLSAKELARIQLKARNAGLEEQQRQQEREELAAKHNMHVEDLAPTDTDESLNAAKQAAEREAIDKAIDDQTPADPLDLKEVQVTTKTGQQLSAAQLLTLQTLQGTTRPEMAKLLNNLGINLSVRLSKTDTANLLACLLTCNETQLAALMTNDKLPLAIKAIIKRIQQDARVGETATIERIWDRLFGKGPMSLDATPITGVPSAAPGLIPDQPISREAYVIIRETLLK